jgi:hypothetical protein
MTKTNCDCPNTDPARGANLVDLYKAYTEALIKPDCEFKACQEKFNEHLYATYRFAVANIDLNCLRTLSTAQITCLIGKLDLYSNEMLLDVPAITCVDPCDALFEAYITPNATNSMSGTILSTTNAPVQISISTSTTQLFPYNPSVPDDWKKEANYNLPCSKADATCSDVNRTYTAVVTADISHLVATNPTNMTLSINENNSVSFPVPIAAGTKVSNDFTIQGIKCGTDILAVKATLSTTAGTNVDVTITRIAFKSESVEC